MFEEDAAVAESGHVAECVLRTEGFYDQIRDVVSVAEDNEVGLDRRIEDLAELGLERFSQHRRRRDERQTNHQGSSCRSCASRVAGRVFFGQVAGGAEGYRERRADEAAERPGDKWAEQRDADEEERCPSA